MPPFHIDDEGVTLVHFKVCYFQNHKNMTCHHSKSIMFLLIFAQSRLCTVIFLPVCSIFFSVENYLGSDILFLFRSFENGAG